MMVKPTDPDFPEVRQNLLGVIKSQQGQHDSAIAPLQIGYQKGLVPKSQRNFKMLCSSTWRVPILVPKTILRHLCIMNKSHELFLLVGCPVRTCLGTFPHG